MDDWFLPIVIASLIEIFPEELVVRIQPNWEFFGLECTLLSSGDENSWRSIKRRLDRDKVKHVFLMDMEYLHVRPYWLGLNKQIYDCNEMVVA